MISRRWTPWIPGRRGLLSWLLAAMTAAVFAYRGDLSLAYRLAEGRRALAAGNPAGALRSLERDAELGAPSPEWHYLLARAERRAGHFAAAEQQLAQARDLGWNAEDVQREELLLEARRGQVKKVERELVALLESGTSDEAAEEIYEAMSQGYWASYYVADAVQCLEFWIAWQPNNLVPRLWIADLYKRSDKPNAAAVEYAKILELDRKHPEALVRLGELSLRKLELDEAADSFARCLADSPETPDALLGLAECRRRKGASDEVKELLYEALSLELTPLQASQALATLGTLELENRDYGRAIRLLEESVALDGNDPAIHVSLAAALTAVGREELAAVERERGRATSDRHARLMRTTSKAVEEPENPDWRCEAGLILMEQGFWSEGADWIKTALAIDPRHRAAHEGLAKFYDHLGDVEQAKQHRAVAEQSVHAGAAANGKEN